jgi:RNA polymerase sigma-70 factor (ECF subfamily)
MNATDTDEALMRRLGEGHEQALGLLMERWRGRLWCFIQRMCPSPQAAEEVYQDVWTRLYLYRRRFRPQMPFRPYLFAVATNCCRRAAKGAAWMADPLGDYSQADQTPGRDPPPLADLVAREEQEILHRAIEDLPPMQRAVVLLYLLMEADYGQVALVLGRSRGTVRSHMHHALVSLRRGLARRGLGQEMKVSHD